MQKTLLKSLGRPVESLDDYLDIMAIDPTPGGWSRGDVGCPIVGSDNAWVVLGFGDTIRTGDIWFARNSFIMVDAEGDGWWLTSGSGGLPGGTTVQRQDDPNTWFWPSGGAALGPDSLVVFGLAMRSGTPYYTAAIDYAIFDGLTTATPTMTAMGVTGLDISTGIGWSGLPFVHDGYVYLYGVNPSTFGQHVARKQLSTIPTDYEEPWEYWAANAWSTNVGAAQPVPVDNPGIVGLNVIRYKGGFLASAKPLESAPELGYPEAAEIRMYWSRQPTGPWRHVGYAHPDTTNKPGWFTYASYVLQLPGVHGPVAWWSQNGDSSVWTAAGYGVHATQAIPPHIPEYVPEWEPLEAVQGCISHFDAWDLAATHADGALVSRWPNRVGPGRDLAATGSARPTFKSADGECGPTNRPVVRFDGVNDVLATVGTQPLWSQPCTVFLVAQRPSAAPGVNVGVLDAPAGTNRLRFRYTAAGTPEWNLGTAVPLPSGSTPGAMEVYTARLDPDNGIAPFVGRVNGTTVTGSYPGAGAIQGLTIGREQGGGFYQGDVAEVVIFDRALSDLEIAAVEAYLERKHQRLAAWAPPTPSSVERLWRRIWPANSGIDYWEAPDGSTTAQPAGTALDPTTCYEIVLPGSAQALAGPGTAWTNAAHRTAYMATERRWLNRSTGATFTGGLDIKVIGGRIDVRTDWVKAADSRNLGGGWIELTPGVFANGAPTYETRCAGLSVEDWNGTLHVEGIHIGGPHLYRPLNFGTGTTGSVLQVQFIHIEHARYLNTTGSPWLGNAETNQPSHDGGEPLRIFKGPSVLRVADITVEKTAFQTLTLRPTFKAVTGNSYLAPTTVDLCRIDGDGYGPTAVLALLGAVLPPVSTTTERDTNYPASFWRDASVYVTGPATWYRSNGTTWVAITVTGAGTGYLHPAAAEDVYLNHRTDGVVASKTIDQLVYPLPDTVATDTESKSVTITDPGVTGRLRGAFPPGGHYASRRDLTILGAYRPRPTQWATLSRFEHIQRSIAVTAGFIPADRYSGSSVVIIDYQDREDTGLPANDPINVTERRIRRAFIATLKAQGAHPVAYIPAGYQSDWRRDFETLNQAGMLANIGPWPANSYWVDFTINPALALAAVKARIDSAVADGFVGVELDGLEAVEWGTAETDIVATHAQQIAFNRACIRYAHTRGLFVIFNGYLERAADFIYDVEGIIAEDLYPTAGPWGSDVRYNRGTSTLPYFTFVGKPVQVIQHPLAVDSAMCTDATNRGWLIQWKPADNEEEWATCQSYGLRLKDPDARRRPLKNLTSLQRDASDTGPGGAAHQVTINEPIGATDARNVIYTPGSGAGFNRIVSEAVGILDYRRRTHSRRLTDTESLADSRTTNLSTGTTNTPYDALILSDNPILYVAPDGTAGSLTDRTGRGHTVTAAGSPTATVVKAGEGALAFNGSNQYLQIADANDLSPATTGRFTVECWMRPDALEFANDEGTGYVHWMGKGTPTQHEWACRMYSQTTTDDPPRPNRISGYAFNLAGGLGTGSYFQDPVVAGEWMHYVFQIDSLDTSDPAYPNGWVQIWRDGVLRDKDDLNSSNTITLGNGTAPMRIGTRDFNSWFQGAIGKVALYDRILTPAEIAEHYAAMGVADPGMKSAGAATAATAGTSLPITVTRAAAVGETVVVAVAHAYNASAPTVTDNRGNVYTRDRTAPGSTALRASLFTAPVTTALQVGDTITVTTPSVTNRVAAAFTAVGIDTSNLRVDAGNNQAANSTGPTANGVTTTTANDRAIGVIAVQGTTADTFTQATGWTSEHRASVGNVTLAVASRPLTTVGAYNYRPTLSPAAQYVALIVTYKPAGETSWYVPAPTEIVQWQLDGQATLQPLSDMAPYTLIGIDFRDGNDEESDRNSVDNLAATQARRDRIAAWHAQGKRVWAYMDGGLWQPLRWDADEAEPLAAAFFDPEFPDVRWLDFVTGSNLAAALAWNYTRIDEAKADGFDGVEFDLVEAAEQHQYDPGSTGFAVTHAQQAAFNRALFDYTHSKGMFVVMKGYSLKTGDFVNDADMALMESAYPSDEDFAGDDRHMLCRTGLGAYTAAGKLAVVVQYPNTLRNSVCTDAASRGWHLFFKQLMLTKARTACP